MQLYLPNRKMRSGLYQPNNVETPPGDPAHMSFQWALNPMDAKQLTRIVDVDKYIWGLSGSFFHQPAPNGDGLQGAGVKVQLTHIHGKINRTLFNKPLNMQNVMAVRPANNNATVAPSIMKPTYPLHGGDSIMVQVFSMDRLAIQLVEIVLWCNETSTKGVY